MKLRSMPKDLFAEILDYMADYESFEGLGHLLEGEYSVVDLKAALRETAHAFRREAQEDQKESGLLAYRQDERLSNTVKKLLSILSPGEEKHLLKRFGLLDLE